jgi:hypothetical protein
MKYVYSLINITFKMDEGNKGSTNAYYSVQKNITEIKIKLYTYRFKILSTNFLHFCYSCCAIIAGCVIQTAQELVADA